MDGGKVGERSQLSVTEEFLVTIVITMPDIATTFDKIATITIRDNRLLK